MNKRSAIVVTGSTGQLGRMVVKELLHRLPAEQVIASTRDSSKATELADQGVQVRTGDFAEPSSLATAFVGAGQILIVSANKLGEEAIRLHRSALEAARTAGVRRVLYTSHMGARPDSPFAPAANHFATETLLAEAKVPFTSLRHGFYAESMLYLVGNGFETGELRVPEDGPVSWTARNDLAEADAILLAEEGRLDGITPPLTAPEAFTMAEVAVAASELTGRDIKHVTVTDDEWRQFRVAQGLPAPVAEMLLGMYQAARRGDFATVDPTLETLLGRRPQTARDILAGILKPAGI